MSTIRIPEQIWDMVHSHLFSSMGEHFAFMLARWTYSLAEPVFMVYDVKLVHDDQVKFGRQGCELSTQGILNVINAAVRSGAALIEVHNHGGVLPRFSYTDREGLKEFPAYVLSSLPRRPYAATVWGDATVYGEFFLPDGRSGILGSITVVGNSFRQMVSRDDDEDPIEVRFDRQLPWFTPEGQRMLARFKIGIAGNGGTGSQVIQYLAYLGARDFILVDDDDSDDTSMNRQVTAFASDIGKPKVILGRQLIQGVAPNAVVNVVRAKVQSAEALDALKGVDLLFGCFDNDAPRLILNELALAYGVPYFDLAVGIDAEEGKVSIAGGRVAAVLPGGPCLNCMGEIDPEEARFFLSSPDEQAAQVARGYVRGMDVKAPSVVSLNGLIAAVATNEFAIYVSALRPVNFYSELDLLGVGRPIKGQWLSPRRVQTKSGCIQCAAAGTGDAAGIERYSGHGQRQDPLPSSI